MITDPNDIFRSMFRPSLPDQRADPTSPALRAQVRTLEQAKRCRQASTTTAPQHEDIQRDIGRAIREVGAA